MSFTADIAPTILKFHQIHIILRLLLEHGAAVDETTVYDDGSAERTPKEGAELYGFGEILELLEQYQQ